jgi:hypothetical protein
VDTKYLHAGTTAGEWRLYGDEALTPLDVNTDRESSYGSSDIQAHVVGHTIVYVQRGGKTIRTLKYDLMNDSFLSPDLSLQARHLLEQGIADMTYQNRPEPIVWVVTNDGHLIGSTYDPVVDITAFHKHTTDGDFESICVIPGSNEDELWAVVKRTINGTVKRFIEQFQTYEWSDVENAIFMDSAVTYSGTAATTVSGADHLEGCDVSIMTDGAVHPSKTVTGGTVTLDWAASHIHIGLPYSSNVTTMRINAPASTGTIQGKQQRVFKATVRLKDTIGCKVGRTTTDADTIPFRQSSDRMGQPLLYFLVISM